MKVLIFIAVVAIVALMGLLALGVWIGKEAGIIEKEVGSE